VGFRSSLGGYVEACDHDARVFRHSTGPEDVVFVVKMALSELISLNLVEASSRAGCRDPESALSDLQSRVSTQSWANNLIR